MIEGAEGDDRQPERLAHLQLMVNLAGIHTTSMAITHAIHDLCEHEEYSKVLREEIEEVLLKDGGWQSDTHEKLRKMDSFLKESQHFAPSTLCLSSPHPFKWFYGFHSIKANVPSILQPYRAYIVDPLFRS